MTKKYAFLINLARDINNLNQYLSTQELVINSGVGLGHYHFFWVDKSSCQPYQRSLIV